MQILQHFVLIRVFFLSFLSKSSLPSFPLQRTSRLSGWRRRICSIGGFLCAPTPPPLPKLTRAPSPGTCLMEETTTSTTSAQVKGREVKANNWNVNLTTVWYLSDVLCCAVLIPYKSTNLSRCLLSAFLGLPYCNCLSAGLFTGFICMWLCVVGSHQAVTQTGTVSPCWVMNLVLPNHQAAR